MKKLNLKWYEGGNLHNAKMKEWRDASEFNRLATCADFYVKFHKVNSIHFIKNEVIQLKKCIDAESTNTILDNEQVATIAASCLLIQKGKK